MVVRVLLLPCGLTCQILVKHLAHTVEGLVYAVKPGRHSAADPRSADPRAVAGGTLRATEGADAALGRAWQRPLLGSGIACSSKVARRALLSTSPEEPPPKVVHVN
jgi:hypothetical protein